VAAARREGQSQRQIADNERVSRAQVRKDLAEAETRADGGHGAHPAPEGGTVTGKDGKNYPATAWR
jgi:hypothetical protein